MSEEKIQFLEAEIAALKERNRRVELEKSWEVSFTRKITIIALTYLVMCLVFLALDTEHFLTNAIVPTLGFFLSTLSLPLIKRIWLSRK